MGNECLIDDKQCNGVNMQAEAKCSMAPIADGSNRDAQAVPRSAAQSARSAILTLEEDLGYFKEASSRRGEYLSRLLSHVTNPSAHFDQHQVASLINLIEHIKCELRQTSNQ